MLYYFKTKFPVCCHLSVPTKGYQVHIRYTLYPFTFGNDDKLHQNKSLNEITVQLFTVHCSLCKSGIISGAKSEVHRININLGTNVNRIICCVWITFFAFIYY